MVSDTQVRRMEDAEQQKRHFKELEELVRRWFIDGSEIRRSPLDMAHNPWFAGFYMSELVQDFFQYGGPHELYNVIILHLWSVEGDFFQILP